MRLVLGLVHQLLTGRVATRARVRNPFVDFAHLATFRTPPHELCLAEDRPERACSMLSASTPSRRLTNSPPSSSPRTTPTAVPSSVYSVSLGAMSTESLFLPPSAGVSPRPLIQTPQRRGINACAWRWRGPYKTDILPIPTDVVLAEMTWGCRFGCATVSKGLADGDFTDDRSVDDKPAKRHFCNCQSGASHQSV